MKIHTFPRLSAKKKNMDMMKLFITDPRFQENIERLRRMPNPYKGIYKDVDVAPYMGELVRFCESTGLPKNFYKHIRDYILYGTISAPLNNFDVVPHFINNECKVVSHVSPNIYTNLTEDELEDFRREVTPHR